jgi:N-acetylmuramic acid 6-phosphate etherase
MPGRTDRRDQQGPATLAGNSEVAEHYAIPTEAPNPRTKDIDLLKPLEVLELLNAEDELVPRAVAKVIPDMARAVDLMVSSVRRGGHVHYFGAGTSGRLATADAAELPPTYGVAPDLFVAHHAGGDAAGSNALEHAEDDAEAGAEAATTLQLTDVAIGIAASGFTPYVVGALRRAKRNGAATVLISSNPGAPIGKEVDCLIAPDTGPEPIAGSTRMKAGTAAKLILNGLSTATMVALGRTYSHHMVNMKATNAKLRRRSLRILGELASLSPERCAKALDGAGGDLDIALTALLAGVEASEARVVLERNNGSVRAALRDLEKK